MNKKLILTSILTGFVALVAFVATPSVVDAAWWNPLSWKKASVKSDALISSTTPITTESVTGNVTTFATPSTEELLRRIAELEDKLAKALEYANKAKVAETMKPSADAPAVTAKTSVTPASPAGLSLSEINSKVRPALVYLDTASTSAVGVLIDGQGTILTSGYKGLIYPHATATITMSNGTKKQAYTVGFDEGADLVAFGISTKSSPAYLKINHDSGVSVGDRVYVVSVDGSVSGTVTAKNTTTLEVSTELKTSDVGGAVVTSSGAFIGLPGAPVCKVLEEMTKCLKYTIKVNTNAKARLSKVLAGMKLYKDKQTGTSAEDLIGGKLDSIHNAMVGYGSIDAAVESVTGRNSFDFFNSKLADDEGGKITKIYLNKLKLAADNLYKSYDILRAQSYDLSVFLINEELAITTLEPYQKKVLTEIQTYNQAKVKEYETKVSQWSKKKKEYDDHLSGVLETNHDYLMDQGVTIETAAEALKAEKKKVLDMFSGENIAIF